MAELDMEKDFELDELAVEMPEEVEGDDFGLGEFASADAPESEIAEFAPTEVEKDEELDDEVGMEKIASCFPDWSLTPDKMFKMDETNSKKKKK